MQSHLDLMKAKAEVQAGREHLDRLLGLSDERINWQIAVELPSLPEKELPLENLESLAVTASDWIWPRRGARRKPLPPLCG